MKPTALLSLALAHETAAVAATRGAYRDESAQLIPPDTRPQLPSHYGSADGTAAIAFNPREALQDALSAMQSTWFELWIGTWPTAIDWTAAVLNTHLVSSLGTLSKALQSGDDVSSERDVENDLNRYFSQNLAYYFGEDAFSIRNQAYDDMLWVVLGWLESVKVIQSHSARHYCPANSVDGNLKPWQGVQSIGAFSHRARIFYDISSRGWDTTLCGGGMVWSPYLAPYKNAVTNQLYIAASIGMYLYFPGDNNTFPFMLDGVLNRGHDAVEPHDPAHLQAAVDGYDWLNASMMVNRDGLYVDGFHVTDWRHSGSKCDIRNEMVFTYNQGVILSGLRGLWEGTGNTTYLKDAHKLVRNVINATGWDLGLDEPAHTHWSGLGRNGILEERCDASGRCSQDGQTFKGIFFHHFTLLCEPLPLEPLVPGKTFVADRSLAFLHRQSCSEYATWVAHNARAAVETKDDKGRFGMWWGASKDARDAPLPVGAVDYKNNASELRRQLWQRDEERVLPRHVGRPHQMLLKKDTAHQSQRHDLNDRGRGRTVETQGGGVAVVRALWELLHMI